MRRGPSDGVIINNFFTLVTIVIVSITLLIYTNFIVEKKDSSQIKKLQCQSDSPTKVKVFNQTLLNKSIKAINKGYFRIEGSYLNQNSKIKKIVSLEDVNNFYINALGKKPKENIQKFLKIRYEIISNNEKPNDSYKLNAGSIMTSFKINSIEIFRVKTEFKFLYKNAIKKRIDCSIKVFKNYVQHN